MKPVPRSTFREQIVEALRAAILGGELPPGSAVVEMQLAARLGVSRGPLREAIRSLVDEGLLVTVPYTGTRVTGLALEDVREIFTIRTELESFAFREAWARRDGRFRQEMEARHAALQDCIAAGDDGAAIRAELALHSWVYEAAGHRLLLGIWAGLRGRLQLYWAAHHRAHGRRGPRPDSHDRYVALAIGDDLDAMLDEVRSHMVRGRAQTERFLAEPFDRPFAEPLAGRQAARPSRAVRPRRGRTPSLVRPVAADLRS